MSYTYSTRKSSTGAGCIVIIIAVLIYVLPFMWFINTVAPHTYPTVYTNFFWGLLHGFFVVPTFIFSLFADTITIYQSPNSGNWYNFGFVLGAGILFGGSSSSRK